MSKQTILIVLIVTAFSMMLVGCGPGDDGSSSGGIQSTTLSGQIQTRTGETLPTGLKAAVVGTSISAPVQPGGSFTLVDVPVGSQTIGIVDASGTIVSAAVVEVRAGMTTIPPLPAPTTFTPSSASAIAGTAYVGPISPVSISGQPNDRPYAGAMLQIETIAGAMVTTVTTGSDGTFSVPIVPGQYLVVPVSGTNGFPHAQPLLVTVQADKTSNIVVQYDTGIR